MSHPHTPPSHASDTLNTRRSLSAAGVAYDFYAIHAAEAAGVEGLHRLPVSLKIMLENLLRHEDGGRSVSVGDIAAFGEWVKNGGRAAREIAYRPARVLMQDFTGVPAIVDLAAMRDAMVGLGGDPGRINPLNPVDLVIDHSVMVDEYGSPRAFAQNVAREYERNLERYQFLKWGQAAFRNFRVVPPGTGICHQVNLEYLAQGVRSSRDESGRMLACPDTLVGTDSHTTMVNALAVLGWGVGGIEAEAAMLGQPISMLIPEVVGFEMTGRMGEGVTATDLVLTVTQMLRAQGVVGKFVEFFGEGLGQLALADRATIANMAPEYGATCGFFPIDGETLRYLQATGREAARVALVEAYAKENGLWHDPASPPQFSGRITLDLGSVEPSISGPKRPQDRVPLAKAAQAMQQALTEGELKRDLKTAAPAAGDGHYLSHGDIVIAAITSCTNTSNPHVMIAAGLLARKARALGLKPAPWVKTSLAPGSQVVSDYLERTGLQDDLDAMGFNLVGYGCTTCIGNSGPLPDTIAQTISAHDLVVCAVLSGNRNFEGRISPQVRANYLASPPLVVAYALLGTMRKDITREPLGTDPEGNPVMLKDIWPDRAEIAALVQKAVTPDAFRRKYGQVFSGDAQWKAIESGAGGTYHWNAHSTYVRRPPYFDAMGAEKGTIRNIEEARILAILGDSITTDHISPAGAIKAESSAGRYLQERQIAPRDFNSYGARRGNHEIMMRGTFANIRIRNEMLKDVEGGFTRTDGNGAPMPIFDAAMHYAESGQPLVVVAGKEYGTGSSRDWAAKGTMLLGVKAVIAESFERIHRSNLVGMGVIPFEFAKGETRRTLGLTGNERISILDLADDLVPGKNVPAVIRTAEGMMREITLTCRIDTETEIDYVAHGGVLQYVLRHLAAGRKVGD